METFETLENTENTTANETIENSSIVETTETTETTVIPPVYNDISEFKNDVIVGFVAIFLGLSIIIGILLERCFLDKWKP